MQNNFKSALGWMLTLKTFADYQCAFRKGKASPLIALRFYQKLDQLYTIQLDQLWAVRFLNNNVNMVWFWMHFAQKLFWVKPKSSFAVFKATGQLLVMCHYILNIQIFLTNIRNGGIRMQRFFFRQCITKIYCEYMFVKMNMKRKS
jgi:hypothetical protein